MAPGTAPKPKPTVVYNGACPLCRAGVAHARRRRGASAVEYADIAAHPETLARLRLKRQSVKKRLHLVEPDGRVHVGVPAFVALGRRLPRYRALAWLCGLPGVRHLLMVAYEALAQGLYAWNRTRGR